MAELDVKRKKKKEKLHMRVYSGLSIILFIVMGFYTFTNWQEYSLARAAVQKNQEFINALQGEAADEKTLYETQKSEFDELNKVIEQKLMDIFPQGDEYTALVRQLDSFEEELNTINDPFEVSNLSFQSYEEEQDYMVLPLRMNIRASNENFRKFLHLIETSGSLDNQVRLMDITSIQLTFGAGGSQTDETITFSVQINAYFQKLE